MTLTGRRAAPIEGRARGGKTAGTPGRALLVLVAGLLAGCSGTPEPAVPLAPPHMRVVTTQQYLNTLSYVFGTSINLGIAFPPPPRTEGLLASGAALSGVTASQIELFQRAANSIANQVVSPENRAFLIPCTPASSSRADHECAKTFLSQTSRLLQRRPLSDAELSGYVAQAGATADQLGDFYKGIAVVLESLLVSPEVLFIIETSEPDPNDPERLRLDAYSLASRLSFFLWNAAPDDMLLKVAESGELHNKRKLARVVDTMLASPRLEVGVRAFFDDMFAFDIFDSLSKDATVYPYFTGAVVADAREQTLLTVVDHLVRKELDYRDLFTTRSTFMSAALAPIYQLPAEVGWTAHEFPTDSPRQGLLTHVSFLASHSHPGRSSPTLRGKALRELLLCQIVPPPPPDVDFSALNNPDAHYPTQRERVAAHLQNPSCAGCHRITDPIGLALENFDGAGRFRDSEGGSPIDTSGDLDGKEFTDSVGLAQSLRDNPGLPRCLVQRVYSYASGSAMKPTDRVLLEYLTAQFSQDGYKLPELMRTVVLSNAFSAVAESPGIDEPLEPGVPVRQQIVLNGQPHQP